MKLLFTIILFIATNTLVNAAEVAHTATIASIDQQQNGDIAFRFNSDHAACTNGNSPKYYYLRANDAASGNLSIDTYKNILSIAMTAGVAKKTVQVVFDDSSQNCWVKRIVLNF